MCILAKNVFYDSTKAFCFWFSFLIIRLLVILLLFFCVNVIRDAPRICEYSFLKNFFGNVRRNLLR